MTPHEAVDAWLMTHGAHILPDSQETTGGRRDPAPTLDFAAACSNDALADLGRIPPSTRDLKQPNARSPNTRLLPAALGCLVRAREVTHSLHWLP